MIKIKDTENNIYTVPDKSNTLSSISNSNGLTLTAVVNGDDTLLEEIWAALIDKSIAQIECTINKKTYKFAYDFEMSLLYPVPYQTMLRFVKIEE